ncbi:hypothetical protein BDW02DRAFT_395223 [Decorospora gaudefroyi]|uniref:Uncharacterized protein n=1 Tax=Decorospora gaudefroyi TaxID=184978 RepID=A0A6A5K939_9PLEO|nr:hypothetical protein BDW02DRAFT_395223 [Decorospora gaudefroyi]
MLTKIGNPHIRQVGEHRKTTKSIVGGMHGSPNNLWGRLCDYGKIAASTTQLTLQDLIVYADHHLRKSSPGGLRRIHSRTICCTTNTLIHADPPLTFPNSRPSREVLQPPEMLVGHAATARSRVHVWVRAAILRRSGHVRYTTCLRIVSKRAHEHVSSVGFCVASVAYAG